MDKIDLSKYEKIEKPKPRKGQQTLGIVKPDYNLLRLEKPRCPFHFNRVYWIRNGTLLNCKKAGIKSHVFTLDVISGKRLLEFRDHVKMMGR